jgi:phosphatidylglycerophosphate synthase
VSVRPSERPDIGQSSSPRGYRDVVRQLAGAQKAVARGAPAYSVYVNRRLGRLIAAAAYLAGLSPNAVTGISAIFTFGAIISLAAFPPSLLLGILVTFGLVIGYALDSADGQVARLRGGGGPQGEWLDHVVDCIKTSSLHLAVLVTMYRHFDLPSEALLMVPIGYTVVASANFFAMILNDQLRAVYSGSRKSVYSAGGSTILRSILVAPTDYGLICFVFLLLAVPGLFVVVYALLFVANTGHTVLALGKWFRDMRNVARPSDPTVSGG